MSQWWNPKDEHFIYLHFCGKDGTDSYLKVDTYKQRVIKVCLDKNKKLRGGQNIKGIYEIKWTSFAAKYISWLQPGHDAYIRKLHGDPIWLQCKYTTKNQFTNAIVTALRAMVQDELIEHIDKENYGRENKSSVEKAH